MRQWPTRLRTLRERRTAGDQGAAAVEFAIVGTLVLIPLTFGLISFGLYFAGTLGLSNSARQAARYGVVQNPTVSGSSPASCQQIAQALADNINGTLGVDFATGVTVTINRVNTSTGSAINTCTGTIKYNGSAYTLTMTNGSLVPCTGSTPGADQLNVVATAKAQLLLVDMLPGKSNFNVSQNGVGRYRCEFS